MLIRSLICVAAVTVIAPRARAQWQTGVGSNAARNSLAPVAGPSQPTLAWQGGVAAIIAQQAVIDDNLLVMSRIQNFDVATGTVIVAHDLTTGAVLWSTQLPVNFPDSWRSRASAVRDGHVYASRSGNTNAEYLYALSPVDGSIIWRSQDLITENSTESLAFAANGDLIVSGVNTLLRIDHLDGTTVWSTARTCPTSGGCDASTFGNRVYIWEAGSNGPVVTAFDATSGARLYSSAGIGGGFVQQVALLVGGDGTVYAPRTQNNPTTDFFVAFTDTGSALVEKWRVPLGFVPFASFGVGKGGSVYTYDTVKTGSTVKLTLVERDPASGAERHRSPEVLADYPAQPRLAIDAAGRLYFTNGSFTNGAVFSFDADLTLRWSSALPNVNVGGPAIGADGTLVVCGTGTDVRAYRTPCSGYFQAYGTACAGSGGFLPALAGSGCPSAGSTVSLDVSSGLGGAPSYLFFGLGTGTIPVTPDCSLQNAPILSLIAPFVLAGFGPGAGHATLTGQIPSGTPTIDLYLQALIVDPSVPYHIASTNPLQMHVE